MEKIIAMVVICVDTGCHILLPGPPPLSDHITTDRLVCEEKAAELLAEGIERYGSDFTQPPQVYCALAIKEWLDS